MLDHLGAGGMGVVVAAIDPALNRKVAIKVLHGEPWRAAVTLGRSKLVAEAQAMAKRRSWGEIADAPNVTGIVGYVTARVTWASGDRATAVRRARRGFAS